MDQRNKNQGTMAGIGEGAASRPDGCAPWDPDGRARACGLDRRAVIRLALGGPLAAMPVLGLADHARAATGAGAAKAAPLRPPAPPRLIMIDPGHGGHDPGAIGAVGTYEKHVTLDIARELATLLKREHGVGTALTREDDRFLELGERVAIGREAKADLFISIHADSAPNSGARGLSAYTLSEKASDTFAQALEDRENYANRLGVDLKNTKPAVADILMDLAARHTKEASLLARKALVSGAGRDLHLLENPMRSANFAVLRDPDVPSVLIETGFLSNRQDEALLRDAQARRHIATVLARELARLIATPAFA